MNHTNHDASNDNNPKDFGFCKLSKYREAPPYINVCWSIPNPRVTTNLANRQKEKMNQIRHDTSSDNNPRNFGFCDKVTRNTFLH